MAFYYSVAMDSNAGKYAQKNQKDSFSECGAPKFVRPVRPNSEG